MKKIFENAVWWSGVIMVGIILGITLQFVQAWTEPGESPPGGNLGAPVNTGPVGQSKSGVLGVLGLLTSAFQMPTGAQPGYVLKSDASGVGTWQAKNQLEGSCSEAYNSGCFPGSYDPTTIYNVVAPATYITGWGGGRICACPSGYDQVVTSSANSGGQWNCSYKIYSCVRN